MESTESERSFWWYDTSGDWLTLEQAAQTVSIELKTATSKTPMDVMKAGYIPYIGIEGLLPLYMVIKEPQILYAPSHLDVSDCPSFLHEWLRFTGEVFLLPPRDVERLVLLGEFESDSANARVEIYSNESLPGWSETVDWAAKSRSWRWCADYCIRPGMKMDVADVRVDGEDLRRFIDQAKAMREKEDALSSLSTTDEEADSVSFARTEYPYSWCSHALELARPIYTRNKALSLEKIGDMVSVQMAALIASGKSQYAARGGKSPSGASIKRHALKGLKG